MQDPSPDAQTLPSEWEKKVSPYFLKIWGELSSSDPPVRRLYHYTTGENFVKIIESGHLWATQISCLNDTQECHGYFQLIREAMDGRQSVQNGGVLPVRIFQALSETSPFSVAVKLPWNPTFVACFSTESDDLSQWRAYSRGGEGYAIGIDAADVQGHPSCKLARVQYDVHEQKDLVRRILEAVEKFVRDHEIFKELDGQISQDPDEQQRYEKAAWAATALLRAVGEFAPCFKHQAYRAENEWRVIYFSDGRDGSRMRFTQRRGFLARHVALFGSGNGNDQVPLSSLLREVVIGPCAYPDVSLASLAELLRIKGYTDVRPVASQIPFRSV